MIRQRSAAYVNDPGYEQKLAHPCAVKIDSQGRIWVSEWHAGQLARLDPASGQWTEWALPGEAPRAYAVFVDDADIVWVSDFGGNAIHRFDPSTETFDTFALPSTPGNVRQILGRAGEIWGAESAADQLIVIRRPAAVP